MSAAPPELPPGLRSRFVVAAFSGPPTARTWVVRDTATDQLYRVSRAIVAGWAIPLGEAIGPSVILYPLYFGRSFVALHLPTG